MPQADRVFRSGRYLSSKRRTCAVHIDLFDGRVLGENHEPSTKQRKPILHYVDKAGLMSSLLSIFVVLQLGDIYTTHKILQGGGYERNPILAKLFDRFGVLPTLLVSKTVIVVLVLLVLKDWPWTVAALDVFYAGIVINNLIQIKRK